MARDTLDADYNNYDRQVEFKLVIFFTTTNPLVVTKSDYLVSCGLLEETQSESSSPISDVSSNELTFELYNDAGLFTPTNTLSRYYGQIKHGVKVEAYCRALALDDETNWDKLGTFYVTEWSTTAGGLVASVSANDKLYSIFEAPTTSFNIVKNISYAEFFQRYFNIHNVEHSVDSTLTTVLPYAFIDTENKEFLSDVTKGSMSMCFCDRQGSVVVANRLTSKPLRVTLTDSDQIITVNVKQSIEAAYTGCEVTCNTIQEKASTQVLSLNDIEVSSNGSVHSNVSLSTSRLRKMDYSRLETSKGLAVRQIHATPSTISFNITNDGTEKKTTSLALYGTILETVSNTIVSGGLNSSNLLKVDSEYVQTDAQAAAIREVLENVVSIATPTISVDIRGNAKLLLGDKIRIQSDRFKTDFTGILIRSSYSYDGGLKCTITLMDASIFEEV